MTALFIVIFLDQWKAYSSHIQALLGLACTIGVLLVVGPGNLVIPSMILIVIALMVARKQIEDRATTPAPGKEDDLL
jgi:4-azaleucine resistance transporter AzlC